MNICYVNDLRNFPNWGCRSTGASLAQLIEEKHIITARIGAESGNNCGLWNLFAEPMIRIGGILPHNLINKAWQVRQRSRHVNKIIFTLDRLTGARHDFICKNPKDSVKRYKETGVLPNIYESIKHADAVVINGEGTMIFKTPMGRDALFLLFILELVYELKKPVYFLNAMFSDSPLTRRDDYVMSHVPRLLETCKAIVVRDHMSLKLLNEICKNENVTVLPDALFSWQEKILSVQRTIIDMPDLILPFGADDYIGYLDLKKPYLCLAGSSLLLGTRDAQLAYCNLYRKLKCITDQVIIVQTCEGDAFLEEVARSCGALIIRQQIPVIIGAALLAGAAAFVTGRFHPAIMASCGGTPCVFMSSNSHKNRSLQDSLGYKNISHYSSLPSDADIDAIVLTVKDFISQGQDLRKKILMSAQELAQQARTVLGALRNNDL